MPSVPALLLRLLLCATLLLGGVASSVAGVRMAAHSAGGDAMHAATEQHAAVATEDCGHAAPTAMPEPERHDGHGDEDCLSACLALCLLHCHAVFAEQPRLPPSGHPHAGPAQRATPAPHASPSAPPIRPPIA